MTLGGAAMDSICDLCSREHDDPTSCECGMTLCLDCYDNHAVHCSEAAGGE